MNSDKIQPIAGTPINTTIFMRPKQTINNQNNDITDDSAFADYKYLFFVLIKKWWIIALIAIVSGIIAAIYSFFFAKPIFSAEASLYLYSKTSQSALLSELNASELLVKDSLEIIKSNTVMQTAIKKITVATKPSISSLKNSTFVSSQSDTRIIRIRVEDTNASDTALYANAIAKSFVEEMSNLIGSDYQSNDIVNVLDEANKPTSPIKPNKLVNILIAVLIGVFSGAALLFVLEKIDDTLKSPEKVKAISGLPMLGAIMFFDEK